MKGPAVTECHVEGPRNRRGGQSQDVHVRTQGLQSLLVPHPEPVLFINNDQPEILEARVRVQQPVGCDDDVDRSASIPSIVVWVSLELPNRTTIPPGRPSPRTGRGSWSGAAGPGVSWCEQRDLFARLDRRERGAHRYFGLAEPDVAHTMRSIGRSPPRSFNTARMASP